jgi:hypothetical protein
VDLGVGNDSHPLNEPKHEATLEGAVELLQPPFEPVTRDRLPAELEATPSVQESADLLGPNVREFLLLGDAPADLFVQTTRCEL